LFQLAADLPAAVLARMLGIHIAVAVTWQPPKSAGAIPALPATAHDQAEPRLQRLPPAPPGAGETVVSTR
jgi:hypothetical protein